MMAFDPNILYRGVSLFIGGGCGDGSFASIPGSKGHTYHACMIKIKDDFGTRQNTRKQPFFAENERFPMFRRIAEAQRAGAQRAK